MLYVHPETNTFGISHEQLRHRLPNFSIPFGTPEVAGYISYQQVAAPPVAFDEMAVEVYPVGLVQQWQVVKLPLDEYQQKLDAAGSEVRQQRGALLAGCDWTQLPDVQLSEEQITAWRAYRQQLRDITAQNGYPLSVRWPTQPV